MTVCTAAQAAGTAQPLGSSMSLDAVIQCEKESEVTYSFEASDSAPVVAEGATETPGELNPQWLRIRLLEDRQERRLWLQAPALQEHVKAEAERVTNELANELAELKDDISKLSARL